jgi:hypothetical protein
MLSENGSPLFAAYYPDSSVAETKTTISYCRKNFAFSQAPSVIQTSIKALPE